MSSLRTVCALRRALLSSLVFAPAAFAQDVSPVAPVTTEAHWGYDQTVSPDHWGELPGDRVCAVGANQSPIALSEAGSAHRRVEAPAFHYATSHVRMVNTGHTVQFNYDVGSTMTVGSNVYKLAQFHFHAPSEHTKDGVRYPLELHLVHTDANGVPAAVVGVLIEEGAVNAALYSAFQKLPKHEGEQSAPVGALVNAAALLPRDRAFFQYQGSLTTPPCTEGVQWYVMKHPIEMSDAQIAAFERLPHLNPNNRPVQPLHERTVTSQGNH